MPNEPDLIELDTIERSEIIGVYMEAAIISSKQHPDVRTAEAPDSNKITEGFYLALENFFNPAIKFPAESIASFFAKSLKEMRNTFYDSTPLNRNDIEKGFLTAFDKMFSN